MNPLDTNQDCEFALYFKNLGYEYSWDFSKRDRKRWHELLKNGELILQIEMVPLKEIIKDFCTLEETKTDWFVNGPEDKYQEVLEKVREFEKRKVLK